MVYGYVVGDYIGPISGTVQATDLLYRIRRYARSGGYRSIIVTEGNKPVGLIRWPDIERANIPDTSLARDIMLANSPALTTRTSVRDARTSLEITRMDRLPVIDDQGDLIGVFIQEATKDLVDMDASDGPRSRDGTDLGEQVRQVFTVQPGMEVYSSEGTLLGLVDRLFLESGAASGFLVAYGPGQRSHKYLDINTVERMHEATITLSVSGDTFANLPDIESDAD